MASSSFNGVDLLGTHLQALLMADGIVPGAQPSYDLCKTIYLYHPMGAKIVDFPIQMAMFKPREIVVPNAPDDGKMFIDAFKDEWRAVSADNHIMNTARLARVYGVSTLGLMVKGDDTQEAVDLATLDKASISFSIWDPLNTAGSLVLNQDPNAMDFQKVAGVSVSGKTYHRSRACVILNEQPVYIAYEASGFGFVGRSIYQRGLVPLKSFILTLATDMMIALKAGVLIAKMESQSSAVDGIMGRLFGVRREMVKEAQTGNVLSIGTAEDIESLNLQNLDGAYGMARRNIIENIASACGTPAKILLAESFAAGFSDGDNDAVSVAQHVDSIRAWMQPLYSFMDTVVMYRAWNEEFYKSVQEKYPNEYGSVSYQVAFQSWKNSFRTEWPNLLDEPESEKLKGEEVILKAIIAVVEVLIPAVPPEVKAQVIQWMMDNLNQRKRLFASPMDLDTDAIADYEPPVPGAGGFGGEEGEGPKPVAVKDSARRRTKEMLDGLDDDIRRRAMQGLKLVSGQAVD